MAGNLYVNDNLAKTPPCQFQIAISDENYHIFRDYLVWECDCDSIGRNTDLFSKVAIRQAKTAARKVVASSEIAELAFAGNLFNGKLRFAGGTHAFALDFPVKHINIEASGLNFQVETGPVLIPEGLFVSDCHIEGNDRMRLGTAYVFFNRFDRAEFIVKALSGAGGQRFRCYSDVIKVEVDISLLTPVNSIPR